MYPFSAGGRSAWARNAVDGLCIALAVAALAWPIVDFDAFVLRAATPTTLDLVLGAIATLLILEATRRTTGWILPVTAALFLAYAYFGALLDQAGLSLIAHRGYSVPRILGTLYMTLEGIFGVPLDVTATYIVLFTIYGAVLEHSGAGRFFIDWAAAAVGRSSSGSGPGRTVTVAGYLLGAASGSGVASTVMLGAVAWPMMRRAGYPPDTGGAILAASGIGAIISPPAMGAAAFLIAEYLKITYLQVLAMAIDSCDALLRVGVPHGRGRLAATRDSRGGHPGAASAHGHRPGLASSGLAGGDRGPDGAGSDGVSRGVLGNRAGRRRQLPAARHGACGRRVSLGRWRRARARCFRSWRPRPPPGSSSASSR